MAGHGYSTRSYTTYNGVQPHTAGWGKPTYDAYSDHICRPVILDAEGRKQPIISYTSPNHQTESYVTKTETIIEHVQSPRVTNDYRYGSPPKDYGTTNKRYWGKPASPVRERPQKVEEFITEVQTEVFRPTRTSPLSTTNWRQAPKSHHGNTGYGEHNNDFSNRERNKPINDAYRRDEILAEPGMVTTGGWARPNRAAWAASTPSHDTSLTNPTNDIGSAVEYLKEVATKPSSHGSSFVPQPRFSVTVPRRDTNYSDTIDSREAARRYASFNLGSRPFSTGDTHTGTIDSREALRRYNGAIV